MTYDHSPFHIDLDLSTLTDQDRIDELERMIKQLEQQLEDQERAHEIRIARKEGEADAYRNLIAATLGEMLL